MTDKQIAESLVNMGRGGYAPQEVIRLIVHGIERSRATELESRRDALTDEIEGKG